MFSAAWLFRDALYGALILSVRRGAEDIATPDPAFQLAADDVLVVVGQPDQLRAATALLTHSPS